MIVTFQKNLVCKQPHGCAERVSHLVQKLSEYARRVTNLQPNRSGLQKVENYGF